MLANARKDANGPIIRQEKGAPMTPSRRRMMAFGAGVLASPLVVRDLKAQAQITLRLHHFLPPASNGQQRFLAPWAQRIEQASLRILSGPCPAIRLVASRALKPLNFPSSPLVALLPIPAHCRNLASSIWQRNSGK
jgi:hypothetical protein